MSVDVIKKAFQATEEGFFSVVVKQWPTKPQIAAVGSCCLVGVICGGILYVANLGDSRAVLGRSVRATGDVLAIQLSSEHNVSIESVRQEMHSLHPDDSQIVVLKHNVWRVKGLIQVSAPSWDFVQSLKLVFVITVTCLGPVVIIYAYCLWCREERCNIVWKWKLGSIWFWKTGKPFPVILLLGNRENRGKGKLYIPTHVFKVHCVIFLPPLLPELENFHEPRVY